MSTTAQAAPPAEDGSLRHSEILRFYIPLAASWLFMAIESPVAVAVIGRLADSQTNLAALLVVFGLSIWIESPAIDLLATSTTLAKNRQHFLMLRRFTFYVIGCVTALHLLFAFTPAFDFVVYRLMHIETPVGEAVRSGMIVMVPWSALIAWRRFLQGILIRHGRTRLIGVGTFVRVLTMATTAIGLYHFSTLPSIVLAASALVASVAAEAVFIHFAARGLVRERFSQDDDDARPLTMRRLFKFHSPLTATTMVMLMSMPVVAAALSRSADQTLHLAAFQTAFTLLFMFRTITFALPEVVITLHRGPQSADKLRRFCLGVGVVSSLVLVLIGLTHADVAYFKTVLQVRPDTAYWAHIGFLAGALMPMLGAMQAYVRGILTAHHLTFARFVAVTVFMGALAIMLTLTVVFGVAGILSATIALTLAMIAEYAALALFWKLGSRKLQSASASKP